MAEYIDNTTPVSHTFIFILFFNIYASLFYLGFKDFILFDIYILSETLAYSSYISPHYMCVCTCGRLLKKIKERLRRARIVASSYLIRQQSQCKVKRRRRIVVYSIYSVVHTNLKLTRVLFFYYFILIYFKFLINYMFIIILYVNSNCSGEKNEIKHKPANEMKEK